MSPPDLGRPERFRADRAALEACPSGSPAPITRSDHGAAGPPTPTAVDAWDLPLPPPEQRRLKHPAECVPRRRPRPPKWMPPRDRRDAGVARPVGAPPGWGRPRLQAAADAGAVRVGMSWRASYTTAVVFCRKSGRNQFFEGPHEIASYRLRAIDHRCSDVQFQPLAMHWKSDAGGNHSYFVDSVEETDDGRLIFRENKAHTAYFEDRRIAEKLAAAEAELVRHPYVGFERETGTELMDPLHWRIVKDIFDDRVLDVDDRRRDAVADLLARDGEVALGQVWEAIGGPRDDAARIANAMLSQRLVGYRIDRVPVADTRVVRPRAPRRPGLLRAFLFGFAPKGEA